MSDVVTVTLRRLGSRYATSAYSTTAYGTTAFGGSSYVDDSFGGLLQGSDIPSDQLARTTGAIVHRRAGVPVSVRVDAVQGRVWRFTFLHSLATLEDLRVYHGDRVFYLLPDGPDDPDPVEVLWSEDQFAPTLWGYDGTTELWQLSATFEEIV